MFLKQLSTPLHKAMFLELAMLMMMAAGGKDGYSGILSKSDTGNKEGASDNKKADPVVEALFYGISASEKEMLLEYKDEIGEASSSVAQALSPAAFIFGPVVGTAVKAVTGTMGGSINTFFQLMITPGFEGSFDANLSLSTGESKNFRSLQKVLKETAQNVLKQYENDVEVKQQVMQELAADGDILQLTPEKVRAVMVRLPEIRFQVLMKAVHGVIQSKLRLGMELREKDKKIILFELVGAGFSSGTFEQEEKKLLEVICRELSADAEYIGEFTEIMGRLFAVNKEAADLINE